MYAYANNFGMLPLFNLWPRQT